jgi:hypothetical protein
MLAWGGALMVTGPLLSGLAVIVFSDDVGGEEPRLIGAHASFVRILGETTPMVALGLVSLALAPIVARRGAPAALAGAASLVSVCVFAPGVLQAVNAVTGSGPILWRMLYVAPIPVLVGLVFALPVSSASMPVRRWGAVAAMTAAAVCLALGGRPVWSHTGHGGPVTVTSSPEWKLDREALDDVRRLDERGVLDGGVVLLPPARMKVLTMYTTDAFPVVPRQWFIPNIKEPKADRKARRTLLELADPGGALPSEKAVRRALDRLDVRLACIAQGPDRLEALGLLRAAGYDDEQQVGSLGCLSKDGN